MLRVLVAQAHCMGDCAAVLNVRLRGGAMLMSLSCRRAVAPCDFLLVAQGNDIGDCATVLNVRLRGMVRHMHVAENARGTLLNSLGSSAQARNTLRRVSFRVVSCRFDAFLPAFRAQASYEMRSTRHGRQTVRRPVPAHTSAVRTSAKGAANVFGVTLHFQDTPRGPGSIAHSSRMAMQAWSTPSPTIASSKMRAIRGANHASPRRTTSPLCTISNSCGRPAADKRTGVPAGTPVCTRTASASCGLASLGSTRCAAEEKKGPGTTPNGPNANL